MPSSISKPKFLVDENVRHELAEFLKTHGIDFKLVPKGARDREVSLLSKTEGRILVTNDHDFAGSSKSQIYTVVLLRLPQNNLQLLISSFLKILADFEVFKGKLIVLTVNEYKDYNLGENPD